MRSFLRNRPPWVRAAMLGMCTGPFVADAAGGAFYLALGTDLRRQLTLAAGVVRVTAIAIVPLVPVASPALLAMRSFAPGGATSVPLAVEGQAPVPAAGPVT